MTQPFEPHPDFRDFGALALFIVAITAVALVWMFFAPSKPQQPVAVTEEQRQAGEAYMANIEAEEARKVAEIRAREALIVSKRIERQAAAEADAQAERDKVAEAVYQRFERARLAEVGLPRDQRSDR